MEFRLGRGPLSTCWSSGPPVSAGAGDQGPFLQRRSGELFPHSVGRARPGNLWGVGPAWAWPGLARLWGLPRAWGLPGLGPAPGIGACPGPGACRLWGLPRAWARSAARGPAGSGLRVRACPGMVGGVGRGSAGVRAARSAPPARRPLAPRAGPARLASGPGAAGEAGPGGRAGPGRRRGRAGAEPERSGAAAGRWGVGGRAGGRWRTWGCSSRPAPGTRTRRAGRCWCSGSCTTCTACPGATSAGSCSPGSPRR